MLQIILSLHNKPLKPHSEVPESLSDPLLLWLTVTATSKGMFAMQAGSFMVNSKSLFSIPRSGVCGCQICKFFCV